MEDNRDIQMMIIVGNEWIVKGTGKEAKSVQIYNAGDLFFVGLLYSWKFPKKNGNPSEYYWFYLEHLSRNHFVAKAMFLNPPSC